LTPTVRITKGFDADIDVERLCHRLQQCDQFRAQRAQQHLRIGELALVHARAQLRDERRTRRDADVGGQQAGFDLVEQVVVEACGLRTNNELSNPRANPLFRRRSRHVAGVAAGSAPAGAGCGFFFQKLSMETRGMSQNARMVASRQLPAPEVGVAA
jgi:hypothetical protein